MFETAQLYDEANKIPRWLGGNLIHPLVKNVSYGERLHQAQ